MSYPIVETPDEPFDGPPPPGSGGSGGTGTPGDTNYTPPVSPGSQLSVVTTNANYTFTSDVIIAAGGPWPSFRLKVTPINDNGVGAPAEYNSAKMRITENGDARTTETGDNRVSE